MNRVSMMITGIPAQLPLKFQSFCVIESSLFCLRVVGVGEWELEDDEIVVAKFAS